MAPPPRVRKSFREIETEHYNARAAGNKSSTELERLVLAWQGIQTLKHTDFKSFFVIAGYHGEPFRGAGWGSTNWWGGYCNHGNILFPTWHRAYLYRLEDALRSIPGCEDVTLPFWDECDEASLAGGIPETFGLRKFQLSTGEYINNPLFSYIFQKGIFDNIQNDDKAWGAGTDYSKAEGYETVRYPLSGLVGSSDDIKTTKKHNAKYTDDVKNFQILNNNVKHWLGKSISINKKQQFTGVKDMYARCLEAPYYTVFSNTTSAAQWNEENFQVQGWQPPDAKVPAASKAAVPLESPHNSIHLSIGGFDLPIQGPGSSSSPIPGANGDMGENDTAAFDPVFYFHHCFVDRVFWLWQQRHDQTKELIIEPEFMLYPGTNSVDGQNPTPGRNANSWLSFDTPMEPFNKVIGMPGTDFMTGRDVFDIEGQLGYTYGEGSLMPGDEGCDTGHLFDDKSPLTSQAKATPIIRSSGVQRDAHAGSMILSAWVQIDGERRCVGLEPILSRWHTSGCSNCMNHTHHKGFMTLHGLEAGDIEQNDVTLLLHTREKPHGVENVKGVKFELGFST